MNLFHALGETPPSVPTEPVSTLSSHSARVTCQPWRLPAAAARQMCEEKAGAAAAISRATATIVAAGTPDSRSAYSGVKRAYSPRSSRRKPSKLGSEPGERCARYVRQLTQRRTKSRSIRSSSSSTRAMASSTAASVPGQAGSQKSAREAVLDSRGSITASFAPPSTSRCACGLK
jgi:hypothetical protein